MKYGLIDKAGETVIRCKYEKDGEVTFPDYP